MGTGRKVCVQLRFGAVVTYTCDKLDSVEWDLRWFFTEVTFLPYKSVYLTTKVSDGLPEMHQQEVDPTESTVLNCTLSVAMDKNL